MSKMKWNSPPEMQIDTNKTYTATVDTDKGLIELELYAQHAPKQSTILYSWLKKDFMTGCPFIA